jgi:hypothetical protein
MTRLQKESLYMYIKLPFVLYLKNQLFKQDVIYLFIFTDTRQTEFVFMITVISYFFIIVIEYYCLLNK